MKMMKALLLGYLSLSARAETQCKDDKCEVDDYNPCPDFELVQGKATYKTTLWLLGENHNYSDKTVECIEHLTRNIGDHIIWLESYQAGERGTCTLFNNLKDRPGRTCIGWNDVAKAEEMAGILVAKAVLHGLIKIDGVYDQMSATAEVSNPDELFYDLLKEHVKSYQKGNNRYVNLALQKTRPNFDKQMVRISMQFLFEALEHLLKVRKRTNKSFKPLLKAMELLVKHRTAEVFSISTTDAAKVGFLLDESIVVGYFERDDPKFLKPLSTNEEDWAESMMIKNLNKPNRLLLKQIKNSQQDSFNIFVAGSAHLSADPQQIVSKGLKGAVADDDYAMLNMRTP